MKILVLNSGSSSIKYKFFDKETLLDKGLVSDLGSILKKIDVKIDACGHRVVHGGDRFKESVLINEDVIKAIEHFSELAPLHNPPALLTIRESMKLLPGIPHVAVFDTAFFQTMPECAYLYAIPYALYEKHKIRKIWFSWHIS